jgi:putative ABC transport system permease protein
MNRKGLLPRLAINGILKNGSTYLPYMGISIFAIFTFFVFDLIINNDIMTKIPKAAYAYMLMSIGFVLLGIIIVPFLYYTNSFLIKRRKKELGLYSILGMEKKHIGIMMLIETLIIYIVVVFCAIVLGLLFSKVIFLLLLNLAKLPVDASFGISGKAICNTLIFYSVISGINLFANLVQVGKANPAELLGESRKGEKEPKHIRLWTLVGLLLLGYGYYLAITSQVDSGIFLNFFLAVFLVVAGTHFLFTSGSISFLRSLKKNRKFYYRSNNFVAVSGMIYRMKKNAASLVNICIFATMAIITLICTVSLYLGIPKVQKFMYPYDIQVDFMEQSLTDRENWEEKLKKLAQDENVMIKDYYAYDRIQLSVVKQGEFILINDKTASYADQYKMCFLTLNTFNMLESASYELRDKEVMVYSTGADYGREEIVFLNGTYRVKEEITSSVLDPKADNNVFSAMYYVIVPEEDTLAQIAAAYGVELSGNLGYTVKANLQGEEGQREAFSKQLKQAAAQHPGFNAYRDYAEDKKDMESMYGGLLFIGIFFGIIFIMCLLIIMYYKQITEGFEDQKNFEIMQKVGMSDPEVKRTIKKQILQVFFIPLVGAIVHTTAGMFMVVKLMAVLNFFQGNLILTCAAVVCVSFALIYGICYNRTARTYYKIVKRMA